MAETKEIEMEPVEEQPKAENVQDSEVNVDVLKQLKALSPLIQRSVVLKEAKLMARAIRTGMALRKKFNKATLLAFFDDLHLSPEVREHLSNFLACAPGKPEGNSVMRPAKDNGPSVKGFLLAELDLFAQFLTLMFLLDVDLARLAKKFSISALSYIKMFNRRSMDLLNSRIYFYYSLAHEKMRSLAEIRSTLLSLHKTATIRHDEAGQEMLLNLLLRNYLYYNLYDQAEKLRSKVQRPEAHSNQQLCRYLFYNGKIRAIQLEYTDAKDCLLQASRKAPLHAMGFRIACTKWSVLVRLLLGEIPERDTFEVEGMKTALLPYFELTNAVRIGDLEQFHTASEKHTRVFQRDRTFNLIIRLRHNVIRTGLRRINVAYSRISLADVAAKLRLDSPTPVEDAELVVSKAVSDGAIDAVIDHDGSFVRSKESGDVYSTGEPQAAFHTRIAFCLNIHNEAIKALRFPPDAHKKKSDAESQKERWQKVEEIAMSMEDDSF